MNAPATPPAVETGEDDFPSLGPEHDRFFRTVAELLSHATFLGLAGFTDDPAEAEAVITGFREALDKVNQEGTALVRKLTDDPAPETDDPAPEA
jgi:hypothetical protein